MLQFDRCERRKWSCCRSPFLVRRRKADFWDLLEQQTIVSQEEEHEGEEISQFRLRARPPVKGKEIGFSNEIKYGQI